MSLVPGSRPALRSVYQQTAPDAPHGTSSAAAASDSKGLLQGVLKLSRQWVAHLSVDDPQRGNHTRLGMLAEDLIKAGEPSSLAMSNVRNLLCGNCRRLNAAQGRCSGQALDRCMLLQQVN